MVSTELLQKVVALQKAQEEKYYHDEPVPHFNPFFSDDHVMYELCVTLSTKDFSEEMDLQISTLEALMHNVSTFPLMFSSFNLLAFIFMLPFFSLFLILFFYKLGNAFLYEFSLFSAVLSFLLSIIL